MRDNATEAVRVTPAALKVWGRVCRIWRLWWDFARRKPGGGIASVIVLFFIFLAITAPWISPNDPLKLDASQVYASANSKYWLGGDKFGRCLLSRAIHGARTSIPLGFGATLLGGGIGALLAIASAYAGGSGDCRG